VQDVDFENELDLLYAVVTLPDETSECDFQCNLYFIDERDGSILKTVSIPTWKQVSLHVMLEDCGLNLTFSDTSFLH